MSGKVGFVIVSHANPEQALRLSRMINRMYDDPPIVCHHDFSQCALSTDLFPANVRFVQPSIATGWGKWSVVESFLAALKLLYEDGGPDWFFLLSASDYPVKPAAEVLRELEATDCDAFIDIHQLGSHTPAATIVGDWNPKLDFLENDFSRKEKRNFYLNFQMWLPILRRKPKLRVGRYTAYFPFQGKTPFHDRFHLFYGEHWFAANRRAARALLEPTDDHRRLQQHLRLRFGPDECYYQTILANTAGLKLCRDNKRFVEWSGLGAHPKPLVSSDLPGAFASGAFFARKFKPNAPVLDEIDAAIAPA
ncbi:beta-1,6-N-acetylglucosaminyltransferase [Aureimonas psammosilenae]|uniref:beta-1,6-N-acetylglucosaminyltransferase n=1 Tax=Aureimonas psammosilenae TaxID=2495496 RepID=UPI00126072AF|nr:beta-1,6-N-acetylglucosaminyltransferase [Aureimonas psammosilenae]